MSSSSSLLGHRAGTAHSAPVSEVSPTGHKREAEALHRAVLRAPRGRGAGALLDAHLLVAQVAVDIWEVKSI